MSFYKAWIHFLENSYIHQIQSLFSLSQGGNERSLQTMQTMSRLLNHPEKTFPIIHVAGTNGKGSVCLKIAKAFEFSGLKVGLFTSPHLSSFRERVRIGDDLIEKEELLRHVSIIQNTATAAGLFLTYFEYCTLLAFQYFSEKKVDAAVIEVGLGGRLDATNIATAVLSIITSIGLDHTEILGSTEELIAVEKGGIIKPAIPVLIGAQVPLRPIQKIANAIGSPLTIAPEGGLSFHLENASVATEALRLLSNRFAFQSDAITRALALEPACRFERVPSAVLENSPLGSHIKKMKILLDVAHNPQGFDKLLQRLQLEYPNHNYHFMINLCRSKNIEGCASRILPVAKSICIPQISHSRLSASESLLPHFKDCTGFLLSDTAKALLNSHCERFEKNDLLVVCGSFFMMQTLRKLLGYQEPCDEIYE